MKRVALSIARAALNATYRVRTRSERRNEAVFLSRQTNAPSYDFQQLARALQARGWETTMHLKKVRTRNLPAYALHVWREIGLLGRCKAVILDRYDPVVSLIDFECEPHPFANKRVAGSSGTELETLASNRIATVAPANLDFPKRPVILQLWHAFGSFKKFGFQSNDTPEGHTSAFMRLWKIHRNYSYVACSGQGSRQAYAEAFSCPVERVVVLDRPERDELAAMHAPTRCEQASPQVGTRQTRILMAPTLRIDDASAHPFKDLYKKKAEFESRVHAQFTWAFHPLDSGLPAPGNVSDALLECDIVVTDYSSIVYEAWLLGVRAAFYVPDLDDYRVSPGLNSDPGVLCPELCAHTEDELVQLLQRFADDPACYPNDAFDAFAATAFDEQDPTSTAAERLADFIISHAND